MFNGMLIISLTLPLLIFIPIYGGNTMIISTYKAEDCRDLEAFLHCMVVGGVSFSNSRCQDLTPLLLHAAEGAWQPKLTNDCLNVNI